VVQLSAVNCDVSSVFRGAGKDWDMRRTAAARLESSSGVTLPGRSVNCNDCFFFVVFQEQDDRAREATENSAATVVALGTGWYRRGVAPFVHDVLRLFLLPFPCGVDSTGTGVVSLSKVTLLANFDDSFFF